MTMIEWDNVTITARGGGHSLRVTTIQHQKGYTKNYLHMQCHSHSKDVFSLTKDEQPTPYYPTRTKMMAR